MVVASRPTWFTRAHRFAVNPLFHWRAHRLAAGIYPELWVSTRRKFAGERGRETEISHYAQMRAAQLVHLRIDALILDGSLLSGSQANRLLVRATEIAVAKVLRATPKRA